MMRLDVCTSTKQYPIYMEKGVIGKIRQYLKPYAKVMVIIDDGVPKTIQDKVMAQFDHAHSFLFAHGEQHKTMTYLTKMSEAMVAAKLTRNDAVIALGGGVVGDMAGLAAGLYMRGIDYINIPTTTLSQIDSSIGGKTAIDLSDVKNCVGLFWQPSAVFIDVEVLESLDKRNYNNGLIEAVKEGLTFDEELFVQFEKEHIDIERIIARCLQIKKHIVEIDEREKKERKLLNFGHTFGHGLEAYHNFSTYLHGECVGMGMLMMMENNDLKARLRKVLEKLDAPICANYELEAMMELLQRDKKANGDTITIVQVDTIGQGYLKEVTWQMLKEKLQHE